MQELRSIDSLLSLLLRHREQLQPARRCHLEQASQRVQRVLSSMDAVQGDGCDASRLEQLLAEIETLHQTLEQIDEAEQASKLVQL
ncbi:MAG: hypothetical protein VKJ31_03190 [Synechococcus sp.]|nr:hypothetical protein [Synechococcus sp.]